MMWLNDFLWGKSDAPVLPPLPELPPLPHDALEDAESGERHRKIRNGMESLISEINKNRIRITQLEAEQRVRFGIDLDKHRKPDCGDLGAAGHSGA